MNEQKVKIRVILFYSSTDAHIILYVIYVSVDFLLRLIFNGSFDPHSFQHLYSCALRCLYFYSHCSDSAVR